MIAFAPVYVFLAPLVPILVGAGVWLFVRRRRRVARALGDAALLRRLTGADLHALPRLRVALVLAAALALGAALADPRWGTGAGATGARGGPVILALDASNSMLTHDVAPSRLAEEKSAARALARALPGTPVGIVAFAGRAYALTPPTVDPAALDLYLNALDPRMVTQTGSAVAAAVRQSLSLLASGDQPGSIVLISDGDTSGEPGALGDALKLARRAGIPVYTLGVGTPAGAPVPALDPRTGRESGYLREPSGDIAVSRLREELLQRIARETGGSYARLGQDSTGPRQLAAELRSSAASGAATGAGIPTHYAWFAAAALLLLVVESALRRRVAA
ncbi:MAG TPA: VWA domain-containing protein [Longimicrobiaceae bacterium]|nr:VWA domain-containing protein [Longimicrobiaceae bacterium]